MDNKEAPKPAPAEAARKPAVVKAFIVRITSGEFAGRYVGMRFNGGLVTNPEVQRNPPVNVGTNYGLWAQERAATRFFENNAAPALRELNALGIRAELIQVQ
jgi:hypothetical protein